LEHTFLGNRPQPWRLYPVTEDPVLGSLPEDAPDRLWRWEVHVRDPEWNDVVLVLAPLDAVGASSLEDSVKVVDVAGVMHCHRVISPPHWGGLSG